MAVTVADPYHHDNRDEIEMWITGLPVDSETRSG
jgi:hypothetical protein